MRRERWYQRSAFRSWWQTVTGFAASALGGVLTWKAAGIAAIISTLTSSGAILFGRVPYRTL